MTQNQQAGSAKMRAQLSLPTEGQRKRKERRKEEKKAFATLTVVEASPTGPETTAKSPPRSPHSLDS